jgi:hypothetical protein
MFYTDLNYFDCSKIERNVYDLSQNFMFLCLLPKVLKNEILNYLNEEAYEAYQYILNIDDEFTTQIDEAKFKILGSFSYYSYLNEEILNHINHLKKQRSQKFLFFYSRDDDTEYDLENTFGLMDDDFVLFRTGGFKTKRKKNSYGMPYVVNDYFNGVYKDKDLSLSFCGKQDNNMFRLQIIDSIKNLKYSDFIIREHWANDPTIPVALNSSSSYNLGPDKKSKKEFIDNIERNLYGLCVRGVNNSSYRLYELFMMGRIPVFLDTDCNLPFENEIPYKTNTVFIKNFDNIDHEIRNFHDSHTEEELLNIQKQNREIWLKYFRVDGNYKQTKKLLTPSQ